MKHYEILFLIHPDQTQQVAGMIERYSSMITSQSGKVHRLEDWGRRQLAYPIQKLPKAHYVLMNIECRLDTLNELTNNFRFNDAILRYLTLKCDKAISQPSPMMKGKDRDSSQDGAAPGKAS